jgi:hypothetical protein
VFYWHTNAAMAIKTGNDFRLIFFSKSLLKLTLLIEAEAVVGQFHNKIGREQLDYSAFKALLGQLLVVFADRDPILRRFFPADSPLGETE